MEKILRTNLAAQVEKRIKNSLIVGMLKPGERLVTKNIASELGTSITPVREALLQLVSSGALVALPAQAFLVPEMTLSGYKEVTAVRKNLETMAVKEAVYSITPGELAALHQRYVQFKEAKASGNVKQALQANCAFRFQLYGYADMPTLFSLIEQLWVRVGPSFNYLYPQACDVQGHHNYEDLLNALFMKDSEKCEQIILKSIDDGARILTERLWTKEPELHSET